MPKGVPDPHRVLGTSALASDLYSVTFSGTHIFQEGEIVLVPRTRGGFTYGQVDRIYPKRIQCHLDKAVSHSILEYQVVVEEDPEVIVKGLPAAYIGKIKLSERPYDEDDSSDERIVGGTPLVADLRSMVFGSSKAGIPQGELVLVPRSKGGFTYGRIFKGLSLSCVLSDQPRHSVPGMRVLLEEEDTSESPLHKDLVLIFLGRLNFPTAAIQQSRSSSGLPLPSPKLIGGTNALMSTKMLLQPPVSPKPLSPKPLSPKGQEVCGECEEVKAVFECKNCDEFYCEECCSDVHSKGKRKLHKDIVKIEAQSAEQDADARRNEVLSQALPLNWNNAAQHSQGPVKGKAKPSDSKKAPPPLKNSKGKPPSSAQLASKLIAPAKPNVFESESDEESEEESEEDDIPVRPVGKAPLVMKPPPMKNLPPPAQTGPTATKPAPPSVLALKAAQRQATEEEEEEEEEEESEEEEEPANGLSSIVKSTSLPVQPGKPPPKAVPKQHSIADAVTLKRPGAGPKGVVPAIVKKAPPPQEEESEEEYEEESEEEEEEEQPARPLAVPRPVISAGKVVPPKSAPPKVVGKVAPSKGAPPMKASVPRPYSLPAPLAKNQTQTSPVVSSTSSGQLDPNDWESGSESEYETDEEDVEPAKPSASSSDSSTSMLAPPSDLARKFPSLNRPTSALAPDVFGSMFKIEYNGKVVSLKDDSSNSFSGLVKNIIDTFGLNKDTRLSIKYKDDEGDLVTLSSDRELVHAKQLVDDLYFVVAPL